MPRKSKHRFSIEDKQAQSIRHELRIKQKQGFSYSHKSAMQKALTKAGF